jgi:hypothetical protein
MWSLTRTRGQAACVNLMNFKTVSKTVCFWPARKLSKWFAPPVVPCLLALLTLVCAGQAQTNTNVVTVTFSNSTSIAFPEFETTSPYPATIDVTNYGIIKKVTVSIYGLAIASPSDIQGIMVVGPSTNDVAVELMGSAGDDQSITNVNLTFDDDATNQLTENQIVSGTYQASVLVPGDYYDPPAPSTPTTNVLAGFIGTSTEGTWSLYVVNFGDDPGTITGGWALTITYVGTAPPPPPPPTGLTVSSPTVLANGQVELTVTGTAGTAFSIEDSTNLQAWTVIATNTLPASGSYTFTGAATRGDLFYLAVVGALPLAPVTTVQTPTLSSPSLLSGGQFGFTLTGQSATSYWIEDSTNLLNWTTVATNTATNGTLVFTAPRSATGSRFYRAVVAP